MLTLAEYDEGFVVEILNNVLEYPVADLNELSEKLANGGTLKGKFCASVDSVFYFKITELMGGHEASRKHGTARNIIKAIVKEGLPAFREELRIARDSLTLKENGPKELYNDSLYD